MQDLQVARLERRAPEDPPQRPHDGRRLIADEKTDLAQHLLQVFVEPLEKLRARKGRRIGRIPLPFLAAGRDEQLVGADQHRLSQVERRENLARGDRNEPLAAVQLLARQAGDLAAINEGDLVGRKQRGKLLRHLPRRHDRAAIFPHPARGADREGDGSQGLFQRSADLGLLEDSLGLASHPQRLGAKVIRRGDEDQPGQAHVQHRPGALPDVPSVLRLDENRPDAREIRHFGAILARPGRKASRRLHARWRSGTFLSRSDWAIGTPCSGRAGRESPPPTTSPAMARRKRFSCSTPIRTPPPAAARRSTGWQAAPLRARSLSMPPTLRLSPARLRAPTRPCRLSPSP